MNRIYFECYLLNKYIKSCESELNEPTEWISTKLTQRSFPPSPVPTIRTLHETKPWFGECSVSRQSQPGYSQTSQKGYKGGMVSPIFFNSCQLHTLSSHRLRPHSSLFVVDLHPPLVVNLAIVVVIHCCAIGKGLSSLIDILRPCLDARRNATLDGNQVRQRFRLRQRSLTFPAGWS